jgi:hypothetical protein
MRWHFMSGPSVPERPTLAARGTVADAGSRVSAQPGRSNSYVLFIVVVSFLAWALVSTDNVMLGVAVRALSPLFAISFAPVLITALASKRLRESARFKHLHAELTRRELEHRARWRDLFTPDLRRQTIVTSLFAFCINGGIGLVIGDVTTYLVHVDHVLLAELAPSKLLTRER